jgi:hypothetical protein
VIRLREVIASDVCNAIAVYDFQQQRLVRDRRERARLRLCAGLDQVHLQLAARDWGSSARMAGCICAGKALRMRCRPRLILMSTWF